jgi:hypothetical protein
VQQLLIYKQLTILKPELPYIKPRMVWAVPIFDASVYKKQIYGFSNSLPLVRHANYVDRFMFCLQFVRHKKGFAFLKPAEKLLTLQQVNAGPSLNKFLVEVPSACLWHSTN